MTPPTLTTKAVPVEVREFISDRFLGRVCIPVALFVAIRDRTARMLDARGTVPAGLVLSAAQIATMKGVGPGTRVYCDV